MKMMVMTALIILLAMNITIKSQSQDASKEKIIGTIVARSFLSQLRLSTGQGKMGFRDDLMVRIEKGNNTILKGQYIRIIYDKVDYDKAALPEIMFKKKLLWEFKLKRDESCDEAMKDFLFYVFCDGNEQCGIYQYMEWTPWAYNESVPINEKVKCYSLGETDFTEQIETDK